MRRAVAMAASTAAEPAFEDDDVFDLGDSLAMEDPFGGDFPDVHALFRHYNELYFGGALGACSVEWSSSRMTL